LGSLILGAKSATVSYRMGFVVRNRALLILLAVLPLTGCLFRSRKVQPPLAAGPVKTATQPELIAYVNNQAASIQSIQATVDIDTSVGGAKKGKITDYQQIRGYVLVRQPAMLRMIGLAPIVRTTAFDMVSDGKDFKLSIPPKNRFVVGRNDVETHSSTQPLENLRPKQIYDALLIRGIAANEIAVMETETETVAISKKRKLEQPEYVIDVIRQAETGWIISRKIVFNRSDLLPHRQILYDEKGDVATDAVYQDYREENGVSFPWQIEISRPKEEYDITLTMVKLELNRPLGDDKFVLAQPPGAEVVHLDKGDAASVSSTTK
jgi:outer membrane lipoprotein-sorting protein